MCEFTNLKMATTSSLGHEDLVYLSQLNEAEEEELVKFLDDYFKSGELQKDDFEWLENYVTLRQRRSQKRQKNESQSSTGGRPNQGGATKRA